MTTSDRTQTTPRALPAVVVELSGDIAPDLVEYVQHKITSVLAHTGRAVIHAHVRVLRHGDPARERPVTARASVRLAGATVHAHADGSTPREAADLLLDRLDQQIARIARTRRGDRCAPPPAAQADTVGTAAYGRTTAESPAPDPADDRERPETHNSAPHPTLTYDCRS